jgi:hypothetical protein
MKVLPRLFVACIVAVVAESARAHFVWLQTEPADKATQVYLWMSETTVPGEAPLLDKIAQTKVWVAKADGTQQPVELKKEVKGDTGSWTATLADEPAALEATCDYGIITRGETFLLQYHARHLNLAKSMAAKPASGGKQLPLDVTVNREGKSLLFNIRFEGKPATDAQLIAITPDNQERELKVDSSGTARIEDAAPGEYALRARVELKTPGERDGKKYDLVRHYTTVTFRLPNADGKFVAAPKNTVAVATTATAEVANPEALELLRKARDARAVWENFPGFKADVVARIDGKLEEGTISVDNEGTTAVNFKDDKIREWAEQQAGSLVQHRLPSGFGEERPVFADDDKNHPLGRLLKLGDAGFGSVYRIRDNQVTEVNRMAGPMRFTITVLENDKNAAGKYLPRVFSITTWDAKSGEIKSSSSVINTWTQVEKFDLPNRILEVSTTPGDRHVRELVFSNYKLREAKK